MTRPYRFTVRLSAKEISAINKYAKQTHVLPSAALRFLITKSLGAKKEHAYIKRLEQRTSADSL